MRVAAWLIIAFGFTVGITNVTAAADIYEGTAATMLGEDLDRLEPQTANTSNMFGFTVADIYDLGVIVTNVEIGSRAAQAGLREDDVILAVNGEPVLGTAEFQKLIHELAAGPANFTVSRFGQIRIIVIDTR